MVVNPEDRSSRIITPRIAKAGAKSETEIIMISSNFSFVSYDTKKHEQRRVQPS